MNLWMSLPSSTPKPRIHLAAQTQQIHLGCELGYLGARDCSPRKAVSLGPRLAVLLMGPIISALRAAGAVQMNQLVESIINRLFFFFSDSKTRADTSHCYILNEVFVFFIFNFFFLFHELEQHQTPWQTHFLIAFSFLSSIRIHHVRDCVLFTELLLFVSSSYFVSSQGSSLYHFSSPHLRCTWC